MIARSISNGVRLAARRPGLTLLIYLANFFVALLISVPVYGALSAATATTGFGSELVERFDVVLWADIIEKAGDVFLASFGQLLWAIPLFLLWKIAMSVGLIHALRDGGIRSFWEGVGHFTGRATLLALLFLLTLLAWLFVAGVVIVIAGLFFSHAEAQFTLYWIVMPAALVVGLAVLDLMHDFGRISLVNSHAGVVAAWMDGLRFPFRRPSSVAVYLFWAVLAALVSLAAVRLHASWAATMAGVWVLFLGQQVVFLLRGALTVAWFGSEVSLAERLRLRESPMIAGAGPQNGDFSVQPA